MKRFVKAADEMSAEDKFNDHLSKVKDDVAYAFDGMEKLAADGELAKVNEILAEFETSVDTLISNIAQVITE